MTAISKLKKYRWLLLFACFALVIFCLAIPHHALAIGEEEGTTAAVNELPYLQPIMTYLFGLMFQLLEGVVFLVSSASLLQIAVDYSPAWINVNSVFVKAGISVTMAMANIFLIAVFVAIAIGFVFKIESFNSQKALPKFFFAALLINFSQLFVGMITDITNILMRSVMIGKEGLFVSAFSSLGKDILFSIATLGLSFIASAGLALPGLFGTLANYGTYLLAMGNLVIGTPHYLIQIMVMKTISGVIFSYAIFFATRIFVIQILTVLAPLAILASALPQTKKWFTMWIQWLLGWSFGGILVLFLLTLGLTCMDLLTTVPKDIATVDSGSWVLNMYMDWQFRWFAIGIYLITVEELCLVAIPPLAKKFSGTLEQAAKKIGSTIEDHAKGETREGLGVKKEKKGLVARVEQP